MPSIKQIADMCNVSKSSASRMFKSFGEDYSKAHTTVVGNRRTLELDQEATSRLADALKKAKPHPQQTTDENTSSELEGYRLCIESLKQERETLVNLINLQQSQIDALTRQVDSLNRQTESLTSKLIDLSTKKSFWQRLLPSRTLDND